MKALLLAWWLLWPGGGLGPMSSAFDCAEAGRSLRAFLQASNVLVPTLVCRSADRLEPLDLIVLRLQ